MFASVDVLPLYIGVGLQDFSFLRFLKALYDFSYAYANFSLKGIVGDTLTTFTFPVSFLWLYLLSIFGLENPCFFLKARTSFADRVLRFCC